MVDCTTIKRMKTKIAEGKLHLKKKRYCFINDEVVPIKFLSGRLRVIYDRRTTYVVCPLDDTRPYEGIMIPIIEDYDSLEETEE